jgi:hypothetical protein
MSGGRSESTNSSSRTIDKAGTAATGSYANRCVLSRVVWTGPLDHTYNTCVFGCFANPATSTQSRSTSALLILGRDGSHVDLERVDDFGPPEGPDSARSAERGATRGRFSLSIGGEPGTPAVVE